MNLTDTPCIDEDGVIYANVDQWSEADEVSMYRHSRDDKCRCISDHKMIDVDTLGNGKIKFLSVGPLYISMVERGWSPVCW